MSDPIEQKPESEDDFNKIELIYTFEVPTTAKPREPKALSSLLDFLKDNPAWPVHDYIKTIRARFLGTPHCERIEVPKKDPRQNPETANIAIRNLLLQFVTHYAPSNRPGAWDYDQKVVTMIEDAGKLLKINPWK